MPLKEPTIVVGCNVIVPVWYTLVAAVSVSEIIEGVSNIAFASVVAN